MLDMPAIDLKMDYVWPDVDYPIVDGSYQDSVLMRPWPWRAGFWTYDFGDHKVGEKFQVTHRNAAATYIVEKRNGDDPEMWCRLIVGSWKNIGTGKNAVNG